MEHKREKMVDALQDCPVIAALKSDAGLEKAWLIRVTLNACHNLRKSVWYNRRADYKEIPELFSDPTDNLLYEEVFALPERYRIVILLYYYEEYSIQEIADLTGRKISTIQTQLARARKKLKLAPLLLIFPQ